MKRDEVDNNILNFEPGCNISSVSKNKGENRKVSLLSNEEMLFSDNSPEKLQINSVLKTARHARFILQNKNETSTTYADASPDWHRADIIAALHKSGTTVVELSRQSGLSHSSLSNVFYRAWPRGERIIAGYLGLAPSVIWPSRYPPGEAMDSDTHF